MSAVLGSIMALWSAKGTWVSHCLSLSRSKLAQPPSPFCMPSIQVSPRRTAASCAASGTSARACRKTISAMQVSSTSG